MGSITPSRIMNFIKHLSCRQTLLYTSCQLDERATRVTKHKWWESYVKSAFRYESFSMGCKACCMRHVMHSRTTQGHPEQRVKLTRRTATETPGHVSCSLCQNQLLIWTAYEIESALSSPCYSQLPVPGLCLLIYVKETIVLQSAHVLRKIWCHYVGYSARTLYRQIHQESWNRKNPCGYGYIHNNLSNPAVDTWNDVVRAQATY